MSGDRCKRCDRPECQAAAATAAYYAAVGSVEAIIDAQAVHHEAVEECHRRAVNWRSRCLAAERDRDEAVARAERAEAECGAMRAVVEAAFDMFDTGVSVSFSGDDQARAVRSFEAAVDEWRRTRQSKEGT